MCKKTRHHLCVYSVYYTHVQKEWVLASSCPSNLSPHHHMRKRKSAWDEQLVLASYARQSFISNSTCWISTWHSLTIIGGAAPAVGEWMRRPLHHRCWPELLTHTRFDGGINDAYQLVLAATFDLASLPTQLNSLNLLDLTPWLDTWPSNFFLPFTGPSPHPSQHDYS